MEELLRWEPSLDLGSKRSDGPSDLYREWECLWRGYRAGRVADDTHVLLAKDERVLLTLRGVFPDLQGVGARYPLAITGLEDRFEAVRDAVF